MPATERDRRAREVVLVSQLLHEFARMSRPAMRNPHTFYTRHDGTKVYGISTYVDETELGAVEEARMSLGMSRSRFLRLAMELLVKDTEHDAATNGL